MSQLGAAPGLLLANGAFLALSLTLSADDMASWGWRVPFLASFVLIVLGLVEIFHGIQIRSTINRIRPQV